MDEEEPLASGSADPESTKPAAGPSNEGHDAEVEEEVEEEPVGALQCFVTALLIAELHA